MVPPRAKTSKGLPPEAAEVVRLIAKGNSKQAVEAAKLLHKRLGTPASETLLVDAYAARVGSMLEHRMTVEAEALVRLVRERHPAFASRLDSVRAERTGAGTGLDELVRPLADPGAPPDVRAAIEHVLRTNLADPAALAACGALPADHPLRCAAGAVARAFGAVTGGPVSDAALALPEVSRRSPLAPWKPLLRAIASFYRGEDAACAEHLRAIDPESAPARLVPALEAMLGNRNARELKPVAARLATDAGGGFEELRRALQAIDLAFEEHAEDGDPRDVLAAIRAAAPLVQRECPEILAEWRRRIAVLGMISDINPGTVASAMGGQPNTGARFQLMMARALEQAGAPAIIICQVWETFRHSAIMEEWFPKRGPEAAVLYLHMAEIAGRIEPAELTRERRDMFREWQRDLQEGSRLNEPVLDYLDAEALFNTAAEMDPCAEVFQRWTSWAVKHGKGRSAETAAEAWQAALPADPRPLLHLMRQAEDRDALKKALGYLRQAEALDGVSTEVRRARLRLLMLGAIRHLRQRKPHLAKPELAELEDLPQARENDRPAFVAALRHTAALLTKDEAEAQEAAARVEQLLGQRLAASFALAGVGTLCSLPLPVMLPKTPGLCLDAIARVCGMGWDAGFTMYPPEPMKREALKELPTANAAALERFGATVLELGWNDMAFPVSAAGLALGGGSEARFLLLRAAAYRETNGHRAEECMLAAFTLARHAGDTGLAEKAVAEWRETSFAASLGMEPAMMSKRQLQTVLKRERSMRQMPNDPHGWFDGPFDVPFPRRRRGRPARAMDDDMDLLF